MSHPQPDATPEPARPAEPPAACAPVVAEQPTIGRVVFYCDLLSANPRVYRYRAATITTVEVDGTLELAVAGKGTLQIDVAYSVAPRAHSWCWPKDAIPARREGRPFTP